MNELKKTPWEWIKERSTDNESIFVEDKRKHIFGLKTVDLFWKKRKHELVL